METKIKVLLVEDELSLGMIIKDVLEKQEFQVRLAVNGNEGLKFFHDFHPDILVADIMMPQLDGLSMVKQIRQSNAEVPILFLSAKSQTDDVVQGFESGGNDYLKKPFGMDELIVRIRSLLNRKFKSEEEPSVYKIGKYELDIVHQTLSVDGKKDSLSHRETAILERLYKNRHRVLDNHSVLMELWGDDHFFNLRSLHVFIVKLRKKMAKDPAIEIINVRGVGYKLLAP